MFPMERFNSWIKQPMISRIHTTNSLNLHLISKRLPQEACKCIDISNDESEVHTLHNSGTLHPDEVKVLDSLYKIVDPEYVSLNYVYENEKKQARKDHR